MTAERWAARLAAGERIAAPIAIVVAHADDETLFAGPLLSRADDALLIHVTDSAPRDMTDARRLGFATREAYAAARAGEVDAALAALGARPRRSAHGVPDQDAALRIAAITDRLIVELAGVKMVATHAYEGGHPDHDAVACAVRLAVDRLDPAPALVEFPSYHLRDGERIWAEFWPDAAHPEHVRPLDEADAARIGAALAAHASQAGCSRTGDRRWNGGVPLPTMISPGRRRPATACTIVSAGRSPAIAGVNWPARRSLRFRGTRNRTGR